VPVMFEKSFRLRNRWCDIINENGGGEAVLDVSMWASRATFDVISAAGSRPSPSPHVVETKCMAGFDYDFNSIENDTNELFRAYKEMFEYAVSQNTNVIRQMLGVYFPALNTLFVSEFSFKTCVLHPDRAIQPDKAARAIERSHGVIWRVAGTLVKEKKRKILDGLQSGKPCEDKDLLALMCTSVCSCAILF
jgi:hypothetical protein